MISPGDGIVQLEADRAMPDLERAGSTGRGQGTPTWMHARPLLQPAVGGRLFSLRPHSSSVRK